MKFFLRSFNEFNTPWPVLFLQNFNFLSNSTKNLSLIKKWLSSGDWKNWNNTGTNKCGNSFSFVGSFIVHFSIYFPCYWFEIGCIRDLSHKKVVIWKIFFGCNGLTVDFDVWEATISVWILCRILGRTCINVENSVEYDWPVSILELFIKVQKLFSASFHLISLPGGGMTKMET